MPDLNPRFSNTLLTATRAAIVLLGVHALSGCGDADDDQKTVAATGAETTDVGADSGVRCPTGEALIARVRTLQADASDKAIQDWLEDIRIGAGDEGMQQADERAGCASFKTLNNDQTERYVDVLYNGPARMAPALALHQTPAAQKAILRAYRDNPDVVTDNAGLAGAVAMAQIQQGKSYEAAYGDLAFAALNDGIQPGYVRGYLSHFGCGYEDAVWAAKTKDRIDFLAGDAFPASTSTAETDRSALIDDRMALLKQNQVPQLRSDCPLSARYAADHNGDTLTRLKLKVQQLSDSLRGTFGEYADMFAADNERDAKASDQSRSTLEKFERQVAVQYAALEEFARRSGDMASARWQFCANRFDRSFNFDAIADCVKAQPTPPEEESDETP